MVEPNLKTTGPPAKGASHVIAGFRYQLLQSVRALLSLRGDEQLLLEVSEDFTIVSASTSTDVQVKHSQAASGPPGYSLQSAEIKAVLERFWNLVSTGKEHRLIFVARGGPLKERAFEFPEGLSGLQYWRAAAIDADSAPLRKALEIVFADGPLGTWVASNPSEEDLRDRLLRRVEWQLEEMPAEALMDQIRDQIRSIYASRNLPTGAAKQVVRSLTDFATEVAARPNARDRVLKRLDLEEVLEGAAGTVLVAQQMMTPTTPAERDVLINELFEQPFAAERVTTVTDLITKAAGRPLVWLHGAHGVGKSMLARQLARKMGGRWLVLDLWPVRKEAPAAMRAWQDIERSVGEVTIDGVIVDDLNLELATALKSRLVEFVRTFGMRGGRVIVTSHRAPSFALIAEAGSKAAVVEAAPYFDETDLIELVRMSPAPAENMVRAWAMMIRMATGGGHPLLSVAKIANLRARGWPDDALVEDIGSPSEAVQLTRDEARSRLLDSLHELDETRSLDAGQLLRRAACVYDSSDESLLLKLAMSSPPLRNGGDAIALLKGSWLEVLPQGYLRVSPLIANIHSDVLPEEQNLWRRVAAEYWLATRTLNEKTLPLCFWNAFLGGHDWVLLKICETMQTMGKEKLVAAAPLLSPITVLHTDRPIYNGNAITAVYLRLLQFDVAEALDQPDVAGLAAQRLLVEIDGLAEGPRALMTTSFGMKVAMAPSSSIPPALLLDYAMRVRAAFPVADKYSDGQISEPSSLLPPQFRPDMDITDFLFALVVQHIKRSEDTLEAFRALDGIEPNVRNRFIDAISLIYDGPGVFVNSGWSADQLESREMGLALDIYREIVSLVATWERPDVEAEAACAISVILDEGIGNRPLAIAEVDAVMSRLGNLPNLVRQKSKVLGHAGRYDEAADLLIGIEDEVGAGSPIERMLALRDGGVSSAKAGRFEQASRLFDKTIAVSATVAGHSELTAGLLVEKALVKWRVGAIAEALSIAADALDAVEEFQPGDSKQAERSHQFARGLVGLFSMELTNNDEGGVLPPFTFGQASQLELNATKLIGVDLKPLSDNWRVLASVEAAAGLDAGIDARSMAKQTGPLLVTIESLVRTNRYASAVQRGDLVAAFRTGLDLVNILQIRRQGTIVDVEGRVEAADLAMPDSRVLLGDEVQELMQSVLLDQIVWAGRTGLIDKGFLEALGNAATDVFGPYLAADAILAAAARPDSVHPQSARAVVLAGGIALTSEAVDRNPRTRFFRDLMIVTHLHFSLIRPNLGDAIALWVIEGWKFVGEHQRFLLRNPLRTMPLIEAIIVDGARHRLSDAGRLLLAVRDAVEHNFADGWFSLLSDLAAKDDLDRTSE